MGVGRILTDQF